MKNKITKIVVALNLIFVLGIFHWQISKKENTLSEGKLIYLKLAPRDPRSLMQGDFMALNYDVIQEVRFSNEDSIAQRGYCVVMLNDSSIAIKKRLQKFTTPLNKDEFLIKYFSHGNSISLGAESYFFEEGTGKAYSLANYGGIRLDKEGNSVLVGLYDNAFKKLNAADSVRVSEPVFE